VKAKNIIAILAIVGLLASVAVSVLGGSKDRVVASTRTALTAPENGAQSQVGDRYLVGSPLGTKDVPGQVNYQGYLVNASDTSAVTDTLEMTFEIFDDPIYGYPLWSETHNSVEVTNGLFHVLLGIPDTLFTGQELWLQTKIEEEFLSPRKKLVSVPYGYRSRVADRAGQATRADSAFHALYSDTAGYALSATIADSAVTTGKLADNAVTNEKLAADAVTSGKIQDATILFGDIGQNSAATDQVMKWNGNAWAATDDETGISSGWKDDGTVIRLDTSTDSVGIGTTTPAERLDVAGNIHASGTIQSGSSIIIDGVNDKITATSGTIGFDDENIVTTGKATIGPGHTNTGTDAFVAGYSNTASGSQSTVGGGLNNTASGNYSTVGGGSINTAGPVSTVGGGLNNTASGDYSTVGGGDNHTASGLESTVGGGYWSTASGEYSTVGGGSANTASGDRSTVGGGEGNTASGNSATVPGGYNCTARGYYSFAAGNRAKANHDGSIVIAAQSSTASSDSIRSGGDEQMVLRADGGMYITNTGGLAPYNTSRLINTSSGAYLTTSGVWIDASSMEYKENIEQLTVDEAITALHELKPTKFNYKVDKDEKHVGFIAEEVPELVASKDRKGLSPMDIVAVLTSVVQQQQKEIEELKARLNAGQ